MSHQCPKIFAEESTTWVRVSFSSVLDIFEFIFMCFLPPGCCLLASPSWAWPHSLPRLSPTGALVFRQWPEFARPFPQRHWQSWSSGRGGKRHLAPRKVLKEVQPSSGQGEPKPGLRPAFSAQGRAHGFARMAKSYIYSTTALHMEFIKCLPFYISKAIFFTGAFQGLDLRCGCTNMIVSVQLIELWTMVVGHRWEATDKKIHVVGSFEFRLA